MEAPRLEKTVKIGGKLQKIVVKMWTRAEHDRVEVKFKLRGSALGSAYAAMLRSEPRASETLRWLIAEEKRRVDELGLKQELATILACVVEAPFTLNEETLLNMPDDEYESVARAVRDVLFRLDERIAILDEDLAKLILDERILAKVRERVRAALGGEEIKNG